MALRVLRKRRVIVWVHSEEPYLSILARLRRVHPGIEWCFRGLASLGEDFVAALLRELQAPWTEVCVFPLRYREMGALIRRGWLRALDPVVTPRDRARYAPAALALASREGTLYAIPEDVVPYALIARADKMRQHGLSPPATWAEFERQARKLARAAREPLVRTQEGGPAMRMGFVLALLGSNGADFALGLDRMMQDRAPLVEAYEWMRRMADDGLLMCPASPHPDSPRTLDLLRKGRMVYCLGWPGSLARWSSDILETIRVLPFPRGPSGQRPCVPLNGCAWCIPHNAASLDAAFAAIRAISHPSAAKRSELEGGTAFPSMRTVWSDTQVLARKPIYRDAASVLETASAYTPDIFDPDLQEIEKTFRHALTRGLSGEDWLKCVSAKSHGLGLRAISHQVVRRAMESIEERLGEIRTVRQVADSVDRNPDYVNRLFRRELRQNCRTYLAHRRMERARAMLTDITLSIKEVASRVGFDSASSFSRAFRRHFGCNATAMRRSIFVRFRDSVPGH